MWLLESDGDLFEGKKLWLRPGSRYLFGRTKSDAGQITVPGDFVSRKHMTIEVAKVPEGKASDPRHRSTVTIEDLKTKHGTYVNDKNITGEQFDLLKDENEIKLGKKSKNMFRITWHPVVLSFSFTKNELEQKDALSVFQRHIEPLDIKFKVDNDFSNVTHVFSKKRNHPRALLALIHGKHLINQNFTDAIVRACQPETDKNGAKTCSLEKDFERNWPDVAKYLPPRIEGSDADRPDEAYAPDERRHEIFDGYTFIFYERKRYEDLLPVITGGRGKALLKEAVPGETDFDEFIRYVKSVAGEKGLGEFQDGSEGRGVVLVRFIPPNDAWYLNFNNQVALRLDHRPIESRDFLPAILDVEPAQLRRPLEMEPTPRESATRPQSPMPDSVDQDTAMDLDVVPESAAEDFSRPSPSPPRATKRRGRRIKSTFTGFALPDDEDDDEPAVSQVPPHVAAESQGLFLTQPDEALSPARPQTQQPSAPAAARSQRKRAAPLPERDIMDEVAPTAARIKRMRLAGGEDPLPQMKDPTPPPSEPEPAPKKGRGKAPAKATKGRGKTSKKVDSDDELFEQFIKAGHEEEQERQAEDELLRRQLLEGDIDLSNIRSGTVVQPIQIRRREAQAQQTDEADRWNPRWNGLQNFKKFRKQTAGDGEPARVRLKKIIKVVPEKVKENGIGEDYWLQNSDKQTRAGKSKRKSQQAPAVTSQRRGRSSQSQAVDLLDSDSDNVVGGANDNSSLPDVMDIDNADQPSRSRKGKASSKAARTGTQTQAQTQTQTQTQTQQSTRQTQAQARASAGKRVALGPPAPEKPPKKRATRAARAAMAQDSDEDEDSEDGGVGFRFGKRL